VADVQLDGLDGDVEILRDEWGIPHVRAGTVHDVCFGQGWVQAEDRLGQLEYDRRRAYGRWAEVAGRPAVAFDVFARRCRLAAAARREYEALAEPARAALDAYAAGVNAWLAANPALPPDLELAGVRPEPWHPWDCCAIFLVRHVVFANWQKKLWRGRLAAALGPEAAVRIEGVDARAQPLIVPPGEWATAAAPDPTGLEPLLRSMAATAELAPGSNAWALHGSRTASGLPLVAGDPHRFVETPGVYAQIHLACDEFDAVGLAFVGVPGFPHFGHNERVAWGVTNANGDYQDLYVERFAPDDASRSEFAGGWRAVDHRRETVEVRGADPVEIDCYETHHGPVVFGDPATGPALAMRSTALAEPSTGLNVVVAMLGSRTLEELDGVMRHWVDPVNNLVSADVDGHIAYRTVGRIPVRSHANAWGPVPGWTGEHEWDGLVPYDELPHVVDPELGAIVTANQRIVGPGYPHHLGLDHARPDRAIRVSERLAPLRAATAADMASVHRDRRSIGADLWVERLVQLDPEDDFERAALDELAEWDRVMDPGSAAAAVYAATRDAACRVVAHHPDLESLRLPYPNEPSGTYQPLELRLWVALPALLEAEDPALLPRGRTWPQVLAESLSEGVGFLRTALGDDVRAWRWGALHVSAPTHPLSATHPEWAGRLDPPPVEMGGEWDTVFSAAHTAGYGFKVTTASVARYVFDLADWDSSGWIVPTGASGDPDSPHFADQRAQWAAGELVPIRYTSAAVEAGVRSRVRLTRR
jgi:penicillin amidase